MNHPMKSAIFSIAFTLVALMPLGISAQSSEAANWPSRPITLVIPYPPGGTSDVVGR
jgi:tripartite-type tricarboxylate transporter receptor subunit TctC